MNRVARLFPLALALAVASCGPEAEVDPWPDDPGLCPLGVENCGKPVGAVRLTTTASRPATLRPGKLP